MGCSNSCDQNPKPFLICRRGVVRYSLLTLIVMLALPCASSAMWAYIRLEELVQDSDLIVVGTLADIREYSDGGTDFGQGLIVVDRVIWGDAQPGDSLHLKWQNGTSIVLVALRKGKWTEGSVRTAGKASPGPPLE